MQHETPAVVDYATEEAAAPRPPRTIWFGAAALLCVGMGFELAILADGSAFHVLFIAGSALLLVSGGICAIIGLQRGAFSLVLCVISLIGLSYIALALLFSVLEHSVGS